MCSACATIRPCSSKSAVEQSRRSLMLAEKAERISTAPISSAIARSRAPITCSSTGYRHSPPSPQTSVPSRPSRPPSPSATQAVEPSSSTRPAGRGRRRAGRAASTCGPGRVSAVRTATSSSGRPGPRTRTAPRARAWKRSASARPERHGELEGLACVAEVGLALVGQLAGRPRAGRRRERTVSRRSSPAARPSARRTPAAAGTSTVRMSSSSASAHACSGPAPPKATSAKSRGSRPCSTETTRSAREHLGVRRRRRRARGRCARARARARRCRARSLPGAAPAAGRAAGSRRSRSAARRRARSRQARGRRRRSRGRPGAHHPRPPRRSIRRRRRPCAPRASAAGSGSRRRPARALAAPRRRRWRRRPWRSRPCRTRSRSRSLRERAILAAPTTPAAGPESSANAAWRAASSRLATPPDERMTSGAGRPARLAGCLQRAEVRRATGPRYASTAVVDARSYSRNSGETSCEATTCAVGRRRRTSSTTARSCVGSRNEKSRQTATASASRSGQRCEVERHELAVRAHATRDPDAPLERDERLRVVRARAVEVRPLLPPQVQEVLEALGRDEGGASAAPLEQRVRGDGRAVREAVDGGGSDGGSRREDRLLLARRVGPWPCAPRRRRRAPHP